jgi:hypothetical protein
LPSKLGYTLLLQPVSPGGLLDVLKQRAAEHAATRDARLR